MKIHLSVHLCRDFHIPAEITGLLFPRNSIKRFPVYQSEMFLNTGWSRSPSDCYFSGICRLTLIYYTIDESGQGTVYIARLTLQANLCHHVAKRARVLWPLNWDTMQYFASRYWYRLIRWINRWMFHAFSFDKKTWWHNQIINWKPIHEYFYSHIYLATLVKFHVFLIAHICMCICAIRRYNIKRDASHVKLHKAWREKKSPTWYRNCTRTIMMHIYV